MIFVQDTYCEALVNCHIGWQADVCVCIAVHLKFYLPVLPAAVGRFSDPWGLYSRDFKHLQLRHLWQRWDSSFCACCHTRSLRDKSRSVSFTSLLTFFLSLQAWTQTCPHCWCGWPRTDLFGTFHWARTSTTSSRSKNTGVDWVHSWCVTLGVESLGVWFGSGWVCVVCDMK